jgi:hypothetical protein
MLSVKLSTDKDKKQKELVLCSLKEACIKFNELNCMNIFKFQLLNFMPVLFAGYNGESKQLPRS